MKAIMAMAKNRGIGLKGELPWGRIYKEDFKWFKEFTMGKKLVVGSKTFSTLPPLKDREIYMLSKPKSTSPGRIPEYDLLRFYKNSQGTLARRLGYLTEVTCGILTIDKYSAVPIEVYKKYGKNSKEVSEYIKSKLWCIKDECIIIGGKSIYESFMPYITEFYVTHIDKEYESDTFMIPFEHNFNKKETIRTFDFGEVMCYSK
jgi:dihydrofolate reductase